MAIQRVPARLFRQQPSADIPVRSYAKQNRILAGKFSQWMEIQNNSLNTRKAYGATITDFCRFIGSRSLVEIKHFDIRGYLAYLQRRGLASPSLDLKLHALRTFFGFLKMGGVVQVVAPRFIHTRKRKRKLPRCPSVEETFRLIEATESPRDRAILEIFYATGCRIAEVAAMRCEDINFSDGSMIVRDKGDKQRTVLFGRMASDALLAYLGERREGHLFRREEQMFTVSKAKPNKNESGVWWRGNCSEYLDGGKRRGRHKWLGRTSEITREQATEKLYRSRCGCRIGALSNRGESKGRTAERPRQGKKARKAMQVCRR